GSPVLAIDPLGLVKGRNTVEQHFWKNIIKGDFEEASLSMPHLERKFVEQCVKDRGNDLVKALKKAGRGSGSRSGQHGTPYKQAGNQLVKEGNEIGGELGEIFKETGRRLVDYGRGVNHY
ncbi:hypothetical protein, partial [Chitiniphilus shinanonensis]|uniref:hypothetical protein n=1 Tax=Chitiniphilus shinanonensis TaxID=553088 RepID=UPI00333F63B6